ncbi:hypothetical protein [Clostridium sp.]|uniref:hypothetical protein n=1 Tax=Clostridium sp. TaxID=1506 RepID=UPI003217012E
MSFKRKIIILFLSWILIFTGTVYTYGFFTSEDFLENNNVSTGEFPKSNLIVKMYASIGPLYAGAIPGNSANHTSNYTDWLDNAGKYAISDLLGNDLISIGEKKNEFSNIPNNNEDKVSPKATIGSAKFKSWMGVATEDTKSGEHGTMIHPVIAISNGIHELSNVRKLNLKEIQLEVGQWDIYSNNEEAYFELSQNRSNKSVTVNFSNDLEVRKNDARIKTYNWNGEEYILNNGYPSEPTYPSKVDLIIFDIGSKGNYTYANELGKEQGLLDVYERIIGISDHFHIGEDGRYNNSLWDDGNHMKYHTSAGTNLVMRKIQKIPLVGMKIKATLKYNNNKIIDIAPYLINIGEV